MKDSAVRLSAFSGQPSAKKLRIEWTCPSFVLALTANLFCWSRLIYSIISPMWNIRMRASKRGGDDPAETAAENKGCPEMHISGAEGIYDEKEIAKIIREYSNRAFSHQKGKPDSVVISMEEIKQKSRTIQSLKVSTLSCVSPIQARTMARKLLISSGVSDAAIRTAFAVTDSENTMRGAALVLNGPGTRTEPDRDRGIRVSRLGISRSAAALLSRKLARQGLNNSTVKEALVLASKVAACRQVSAELCISDDPEYTTGYVASRRLGYVRLPHIKKKGEKKGGRVFFLEDSADIASVVGFLERTPVIINSLSACYGVRTIDEIVNSIDK
jgi:6-carboxyhexanoate--CoA ligase